MFTCKQLSLPGISDAVTKFFGTDVGYIYEYSEVDAQKETVSLYSRNLTFADRLRVEERCTYVTDKENPNRTIFTQKAEFIPNIPMQFIRDKIESMCVSRFVANAQTGRIALDTVIDRLPSIMQNLVVQSSAPLA